MHEGDRGIVDDAENELDARFGRKKGAHDHGHQHDHEHHRDHHHPHDHEHRHDHPHPHEAEAKGRSEGAAIKIVAGVVVTLLVAVFIWFRFL